MIFLLSSLIVKVCIFKKKTYLRNAEEYKETTYNPLSCTYILWQFLTSNFGGGM